MTMQGRIGSFTHNAEHASNPGHGPVIVAGEFAVDLGELPMGLSMSKNSAGALIPYEEVGGENIGAGVVQTLTYAHTIGHYPIQRGSLSVTDGAEIFSDDGNGHLTGSGGGSGTVNYKTGVISVTFNANPGVGQAITAGYVTEIVGVLDQNYSDAYEQSGLYIHHGTCRQDVLKVGATDRDTPSITLLKRLQEKGIYAI